MDAKDMKKSRKNIDILQVASTDKENLSRKIISKKKLSTNNGRLRIGKKEAKTAESDVKKIVDIKNMRNKIESEKTQTKQSIGIIIPSDLTNDSPSERYWEELAESRRLALEAALKENENLHNKLSETEYENSKLKEMYNEACNLVQVLTEMLDGKDGSEEDQSNKNNDCVPSTSQPNSDNDSDEDNNDEDDKDDDDDDD